MPVVTIVLSTGMVSLGVVVLLCFAIVTCHSPPLEGWCAAPGWSPEEGWFLLLKKKEPRFKSATQAECYFLGTGKRGSSSWLSAAARFAWRMAS